MNDKQKPLVTIGIPTYNRADSYLPLTLECTISQTYENIEIIISDNGSTDNTESLVSKYKCERIKYIKQDPPLTPNDNFNFCLDQAQGTYFLLLHDDDLVDKDFIESCLSTIDYKDNVGIIRTGARTIDATGNTISEALNDAVGLLIDDYFLAWFRGKTSFYMPSNLFNTSYLKELGGFNSRHNLFQDDVAVVSLVAKYGRADVKEAKASFRVHSGELTVEAKVTDWAEDAKDLLDLMCSYSKKKSGIVRREGKRFFSDICYSRANLIRNLPKRLKAYYYVYKLYDHSHLPSAWMMFTATRLYRFLRTIKRRIKGQQPWHD